MSKNKTTPTCSSCCRPISGDYIYGSMTGVICDNCSSGKMEDMSIREWYIGLAMLGLLSHGDSRRADFIAENAVKFADQTIAKSNTKKEK